WRHFRARFSQFQRLAAPFPSFRATSLREGPALPRRSPVGQGARHPPVPFYPEADMRNPAHPDHSPTPKTSLPRPPTFAKKLFPVRSDRPDGPPFAEPQRYGLPPSSA